MKMFQCMGIILVTIRYRNQSRLKIEIKMEGKNKKLELKLDIFQTYLFFKQKRYNFYMMLRFMLCI